MSNSTAQRGYRPMTRGGGRPRRTRAGRRRRSLVVFVALGVLIAGLIALSPQLKQGIQELTLPLRHEDIIRQQAREKHLDPALIAAMIYQESKFQDRTSSAGAKGLMQILPGTAHFIARKSGGTAFELRDLGTPQINIAYGSWYLRYLIDRYGGNETLAVAAYNAGENNVDRWVRAAGGPHGFDPQADIPFPETRGYVASVVRHRKLYRRKYRHELGLG